MQPSRWVAIVADPGQGIQIELSFRDLKSRRYRQGLEDSLTREGACIEVPRPVSTMVAFASWLAGMVCERFGIDTWLTPYRSKRRLYSVMHLGRETLLRGWPRTRLNSLIDQLLHPVAPLLEQFRKP